MGHFWMPAQEPAKKRVAFEDLASMLFRLFFSFR